MSNSILPVVEIKNNTAVTTSINVAEVFNKRHGDVLRGIKDLIANTPELFSQRNFASAEYIDEQGKPRTMYRLTRDGLVLLVMGYTGKRAIEFKLAYIEAFNRMEAALREGVKEQPAIGYTTSTTESRKGLNAVIAAWSKQSGMSYAHCWRQLNAAFNLDSITQLPEKWVPDAVAWVQARIDSTTENRAALPAAPRLPRIPENMDKIYKSDLQLLEEIMDKLDALANRSNFITTPTSYDTKTQARAEVQQCINDVVRGSLYAAWHAIKGSWHTLKMA